MWHVALLVPRGIAMPRASVIIICHCVDFDLVLIYVLLFQFGTHLCISDSILTYFFFNNQNPFFIKLKVIKHKIFTKIKYLIFTLKFSGKSHFIKSFLINKKLV